MREVFAIEGSLKLVDICLDIAELPLVDDVGLGVMYADVASLIAHEVQTVGGRVSLWFQEVSSTDVCSGVGDNGVLVGNLNASLVHLHLVGELIVTVITAVQVEVHKLEAGIEGHLHELAHAGGQGIPEQQLVSSVCQKHPVLGLRFPLAQQTGLLGELDAVRFLGQGPCGVATASYPHRVEVGGIGPIDHHYAAVFIVVVVCHILLVKGLYVEGGQCGLLLVGICCCQAQGDECQTQSNQAQGSC